MSVGACGEGRACGDGAHELAFDLPGRGRVVFTQRADGNMSSAGGHRAQDAQLARERLRASIGVRQLVHGHQEHGIVVRRVRDAGEAAQRPRADGHATALAGVGAMVLAADCLPVALGCEGAVAVVHAGWRGLATGVLEQGVLAVRELAPEREPIVAIVGPGAGACCYEVGAEVHRVFDRDAGREPVGAHARRAPGAGARTRNIDLRAIAHARLLAAGVREVRDVDACTICDERFFSHRREGARAGRQAGVAWLS